MTCATWHGRSLGIAAAGQWKRPVMWKTALAKAIEDDSQYRWLHDLADKADPKIRAAFLRAIEQMRGTVQEEELRAALERKDRAAVLRLLGVDTHVSPIMGAALAPVVEDLFIQAGRAAPAHSTVDMGAAALHMRFDIANPNTAAVLRNHGFNLIRQIGDDTRVGIRQIVADAFKYGGHPYEQARQIKAMIGLTDNQAAAVDNFRSALERGDRSALGRALRDKRFDPTLRRATGEAATVKLQPEQIDRMVERYRDRMLRYRAETIARTETINASNLGAQAAWGQAADHGLLDRSATRQNWLVVPDDRTCPYCAAVPEMNPDGVPLGGYFQTPLGPVMGPTLHPNCRCVVVLGAF